VSEVHCGAFASSLEGEAGERSEPGEGYLFRDPPPGVGIAHARWHDPYPLPQRVSGKHSNLRELK